MSVYASHQGISYELVETRPGEWRWSFTPRTGKPRVGRVVAEQQFAFTVVQRAIEVWHQMNRTQETQAA